MNKLFLLLILLCGCTPNGEKVVINSTGYSITTRITHFNYHNHDYIRFGDYQDCAIVHDPDCKACNAAPADLPPPPVLPRAGVYNPVFPMVLLDKEGRIVHE